MTSADLWQWVLARLPELQGTWFHKVFQAAEGSWPTTVKELSAATGVPVYRLCRMWARLPLPVPLKLGAFLRAVAHWRALDAQAPTNDAMAKHAGISTRTLYRWKRAGRVGKIVEE
jgi:hypothetical protein